jgi:plasmid stabilization system protein ParE
MSYRVVFDPDALDDLDNIFVYLAPEMGALPARRYVGRIRSYCEGFSTFPKRGTRRSDLGEGIRLVGYRYKATIVFQVTDDTVAILRIFARGRAIDFRENDDGPG